MNDPGLGGAERGTEKALKAELANPELSLDQKRDRILALMHEARGRQGQGY